MNLPPLSAVSFASDTEAREELNRVENTLRKAVSALKSHESKESWQRFSINQYLNKYSMPQATKEMAVPYKEAFRMSTLQQNTEDRVVVTITVEHVTAWNGPGNKMTWLFRLWPIDIELNWWAATCTPFCPGPALVNMYRGKDGKYAHRPELELPTLRRKSPRETLPLPPVFAVYCGDKSDNSVYFSLDSKSIQLYTLSTLFDDRETLNDFFDRTGGLSGSEWQPETQVPQVSTPLRTEISGMNIEMMADVKRARQIFSTNSIRRLYLNDWVELTLADIKEYTA